MSDYFNHLSTPYQKIIQDIFTAVYQKQRLLVDEKVVDLLETILTRHPQKPRKEDKDTTRDYLLVKFLAVCFDEEFSQWVMNIHKETIQKPFEGEDNAFILSCSHNSPLLKDLLWETINYLTWDEPYCYEHTLLIQALEDYKQNRKTAVFDRESSYHVR